MHVTQSHSAWKVSLYFEKYFAFLVLDDSMVIDDAMVVPMNRDGLTATAAARRGPRGYGTGMLRTTSSHSQSHCDCHRKIAKQKMSESDQPKS